MDFSFDQTFSEMMEKNQLHTVLLLAHLNPDGDACGSVMALAHYIRAAYPQYRVIPYLAETLDKGPKQFARTDLVFDPFKKPALPEEYLVIVCDTATKVRMIGLEYYETAKASLVIDHHAANEGYGDVNYRRISEACAENIYHIIDKEKLRTAAEQPHPNAADYLYLGILHDTDCFDRANPVNLGVAGALMELGVDHKELNKTRKSQTLEDLLHRGQLLAMAEKALEGKAAYVFLTREKADAHHFTYEDIHPISGVLRDCEDVELGFTMYEEEPDLWRCSFRSDGSWINVNELLLPFGGGGHAGAAGLRKISKEPKQLLADIMTLAAELSQK